MIVSTLLMNVVSVSGVSEDAYNLYIFNACLCLMAAYIGYSLPVKQISKANKYDEKKMLIIASIYACVCLLINSQITELTGGKIFSEGMPAVLVFFVRMLRPTTIILIFLFLRKFSYYKLVVVVMLVGMIFFDGVLTKGRRSEFFMFCFTILLPLFFVKGFIPYKKLYMVIALFAGICVYILLPIYRDYNLEYYDSPNLGKEVNYKEAFLQNIQGKRTNDILEATYTQYAIKETGGYNYGADFYNQIVHQFASRTLFGGGLKEKMKINYIDLYSVRKKVNNVEWGDFKFYLVETGFVDAFAMFGYFGCLVFFFFARISKRMWYDAIFTDDIMHKVFYSYFAVMFICMAIFNGFSFLGVVFIQFLLVYLPVKYYSRVKE
jgi:hypothetical protein